MIKIYNFKSRDWQNDFIYARAPHTKYNAKYRPAECGVLKNEYNSVIGEEDYISVISKKKYTAGTEVKVTCSFSGTGAPCIVFTDELSEGENFPEYRLHFEVCIYEGGVNVWHIVPFLKEEKRTVKPTRIYFDEWKVNPDSVDCTVKFGEKKITVFIEGRELVVEHEDFPMSFRVGFTSCEGPCAFSAFSIDDGK